MTDNNEKSKKRSVFFLNLLRKIKGSRLYGRLSELGSDFKDFLSRKHYYSLTVELAAAGIIGIFLSAVIYVALQIGASYFINLNVTSDSKKQLREEAYIEELKEFVSDEKLSLDDTERILERDSGITYYRLIVYTDIPSSADKENKKQATRDEMAQYAREHDMHLIDLSDGAIIVYLNDFSEFYYYNVSASLNFVIAISVLIFVLIDRMRKIIRQIKRLESDVAVISYSDMNHEILVEGSNDIAKLSSNVETMRVAMLENLRKEQEARNANTELITSLSHDIRTPLTVILGYLDMMRDKTDDSAMLGYIDVTEKTAMRLKQLSDDMFRYFLAFGNTEDSVTIDEYDAKTLLQQMISEHLVLLSESGYAAEMDVDNAKLEDGTRVITDADNLMRIFDNIFSNLYKYADKSEPIRISISSLGDFIVVIIQNKILEDTGGAESNKIGLRTCSRLAEFIAESFEYSADGDIFTTRLVLKTTVSSGEDGENVPDERA